MSENELRIIAVSDVHLGYNNNTSDFSTFLQHIHDNEDITDFVLLGDIVDFWRRKDIEIIRENKDILSKINSIGEKADIHYVVGNHDYYILILKDIYPDYYPYKVEKYIELGNFYFIHGYQLEVLNWEPIRVNQYEQFCEHFCSCKDDLGCLLSWLWKTFRTGPLTTMVKTMEKPTEKRKDELNLVRTLAESDGIELFLGMPRNDKLIFGHTHKPFLSNNKLVANTGSWLKEEPDRNTYIKIKNDDMHLCHW